MSIFDENPKNFKSKFIKILYLKVYLHLKKRPILAESCPFESPCHFEFRANS